jgi:hypothetical protein
MSESSEKGETGGKSETGGTGSHVTQVPLIVPIARRSALNPAG